MKPTISTNIEIPLTADEVSTIEDIIETLQYAYPNMSVDDCLKWLFTQGCNQFIEKCLALGHGQIKP